MECENNVWLMSARLDYQLDLGATGCRTAPADLLPRGHPHMLTQCINNVLFSFLFINFYIYNS